MANENIELELYLIRHGESASNAGIDTDMEEELRADPPLSDKGKREAELLGEYFKDFPLDALLSSGMRRTMHTANEVAIRQPENGSQQIEVHKIFTECGTGEGSRNRPIEEIKKDIPAVIPAEGTDGTQTMFYSKGHTDAQLLERGKEAIKYLRDRFHSGEKVMVVAHAAFNTFMLYAALGMSCEQIFDPSFFNTSITKIIFFKEGTGSFGDVHLEYHNNVPHLIEEMPEFRF